MENLALLHPEIQEYIIEKTGQDETKLALSKNPFPEIDFKILLNQIAARSKSKYKLPTWFECKDCIYPSKISIEQASSELTAQYKSDIVNGASLIDLSGGFGVDDYFFSKKMKQVVHCEIDAELSSIVNHNFKQLQIANIQCIVGASEQSLLKLNQKFDWIYVDPSRRNENKGKVFMLKDCSPNVPDLQEIYFQYSSNILIKTSPILDIKAGLSELKNVKKIHIIAVENEVKELLWELKKDYKDSISINTLNFNK
jgi:16S rRNA G966 N2-methylase RsmD